MQSLVISHMLALPLLFLQTRSHKEEELEPVENEEIFDHLFIHDDRKFVRSVNRNFTVS